MKTILQIIVSLSFVISSFSLHAQMFSSDFTKSLFYKDINAKVMYHNGEVKDVKTFYHPVVISNPEAPLGEWKLISAENYEETTISKKDLKAIYIDGNTWVPRTSTLSGEKWVMITHWGAIERSLSFNYSEKIGGEVFKEKMARELAKGMGAKYEKNETVYSPVKEFTKLQEEPIAGVKLNFRKIMTKMTADYPELSAKIENKEKGYRIFDLEGIVVEYNQWYDKLHPDEIVPITDEDWGIKKMSDEELKASLKELNPMAKMKNAKADAKAKYDAKKASRPSTVPDDIASAKPNVPVKKESFTQKIARIKADGNKVGVQFMNPYVYIKPPVSASSGIGSGGMGSIMLSNKKSPSKHPSDTVNAYPELKELVLSFIKEMNTAFDTDVFELIEDVNQVPLRKVMGSYLIDDWWATKYKLLMIYNIDTYYDISKESATYKGFLRANSHIAATEFFIKKEKPSQKIIVARASMGNYYKNLKESADHNIKTIAGIEADMDGAVAGEEIYKTLLSERASSLDKFIAKKKK